MRILFVSANPDWTPRLDLLDEIRELKRALKDNQVTLDLLPAAQPEDLVEAVDGTDHIDILHFSGHATKRDGLIFRYPDSPKGKKAMGKDELAAIFKDKKVTLAVLNACNTKSVADGLDDIAENVICTQNTLEEPTSKQLTKVLYSSLANGKPIHEAFNAAMENIARLELQQNVYLINPPTNGDSTAFEFESGQVEIDPEQQEAFDRFFYERYLEMQIRSQEERNLVNTRLAWGVFGAGVLISVYLFCGFSNDVGPILRFLPDTDPGSSAGRMQAYDEWVKFSGEHMLESITKFGNALPGILGSLKGLLFTRGRDELRSLKQLLELVKNSADISPHMRTKLYHIMEQNVLAAASFEKPEAQAKKA